MLARWPPRLYYLPDGPAQRQGGGQARVAAAHYDNIQHFSSIHIIFFELFAVNVGRVKASFWPVKTSAMGRRTGPRAASG